MLKIYKFFIVVLSISVVSGCYYDSEEDLYPAVVCKTDNVSFNTDIKPILAASCLSCHVATSTIGGGIDLETHGNVLSYANDGSLVGSIKHAAGYSEMPKSASKLDDCKIAKIESWVKAGSPNN
ncbi:MAG: hypothetical protein WAU01_07805 [Saprospiraceae bacterium]